MRVNYKAIAGKQSKRRHGNASNDKTESEPDHRRNSHRGEGFSADC